MTDHQTWKQLLSAYFDDELSSEEKDTVNNHLIDCPACQKYLKELQSLSLNVKALKNEPLSPDLEQRLNNLNRTRTEGSNMKESNFIQILKTVAPIVVLVFLVTSIQMYIKHGIQGTLRTASDDIGDQYSAGNTSGAKQLALARPSEKKSENIFDKLNPQRRVQARIRDAAKYMAKDTGKLGDTTQYEAYYTQSQYNVDQQSTDIKTPASAIAVTGGAIEKQSSIRLGAALKSKNGANKITWNDTVTMDRIQNVPALNENRYNNARAYRKEYSDSTQNYDEMDKAVASPYTYTTESLSAANTAQYDAIYENEFQQVTENPLSTFSIDVDTASYSNVRRFLNSENQLPPRDAVRIEEMINYFQYNYPQPSWNQPFSINMEQGICPWNNNHQLVLVGLQGKELSARETPTSNLVFLIDVSGSMSSQERLPLIKEAFKMMVAQLRPEERVSIVVYAGNAGVVLDSAHGYDKGLIMSSIDRLQAGGSTAGGEGIYLAYNIARKNFIKNGNNRVILATDGDFNVGVSNDSELVRLIEQQRQSGIFLTTLGVGTDNLKDSKMQKLADAGNGNYFYLDTLQEAQKVLVDELGSTIIAIAKDVKIQVEFNPKSVKAYRLIGYEKRKLANQDFNNDAKDAGELGAGHTVTALYEIVPAGSWESTGGNVDPLKYQKQTTKKPFFGSDDEIMTIKLRYKEPKSETSQLMTKVLKAPTKTFGQVWYGASDNLQFASAVAEFGMLLRDSNFKSFASYQNVIQRAQNSSYNDAHGYKNEFIGLVQKAAGLDTRPQQFQVYPEPETYRPTPVQYQGGYNQK